MDILLQKKTISEKLGISLATVNNWIKTQVIPPPDMENYYSKSTFEHIINTINEKGRLNSRANRTLIQKKHLCFLGINDKERRKLLSNLVKDFEEAKLSIEEGISALAFAILRTNNFFNMNWQPNAGTKLDTLFSQWIKKSSNPETIKTFFLKYEIPNYNDDILGAFYQSIQSVSQKSNIGSYYTPKELLREIKIPPNKTILDPCCGSGNILLNILTPDHNPEKIFAQDIDETALKICFINLVLLFKNKDIAVNISKGDITEKSNDNQFDYIITNPPWGSKFDKKKKEYLRKKYLDLKTSEIFSISLYNAVKMLNKKGELYFFLPYSFLNVSSHRNIRKYIFNKSNNISIKLLGNAFNGVQSESILLNLKTNSHKNSISIQNKEGNTYKIQLQNIAEPDYIISVESKTLDTLLIEKIYNTQHTTLKEDTIFALGIVTGNNKKYLSEKKTQKGEVIFRGKDICKYTFLKPKYYIEFQDNLYQQIAPLNYYRQKKIAYRFISNSLICVLDKENTLLLNSANLFIPMNYPMETIVSLFNSDIYTFLFRKKNNSKKVLKSHLQSLPLPILQEETHRYICDLYYQTQTFEKKTVFQEKIDKIICKTFSISEEEYNYIKGELQ